jgi:hypothetical protein
MQDSLGLLAASQAENQKLRELCERAIDDAVDALEERDLKRRIADEIESPTKSNRAAKSWRHLRTQPTNQIKPFLQRVMFTAGAIIAGWACFYGLLYLTVKFFDNLK